MKKWLLATMFLLLFVSACSANDAEDYYDAFSRSNAMEVVAENLIIPWSIVKDNEVFYVTEREGTIAKIEDGKVVRQKVELKKELATVSEAGFLGLVLTPDFAQSKKAYAYYTYKDETGQFNRIVTLRLDNKSWKEEDLLLDKIPSGTRHHGGRLHIGPDGKLYATTGDASVEQLSQDLSSLGGKILRMNLDGSIPNDNPFKNSYIYSYGHRNPQGLTWSTDGTLYTTDHGNNANDEVNKTEAGKNYGRPIIEGNEEQAGMETPLFTSGNNATWAPSGIAYFNDKLYVAALRGNAVLEFNLETGEQREVITGLDRIRDCIVDGNYLYFISNNTDGRGTPLANDDKLYRVPLTGAN